MGQIEYQAASLEELETEATETTDNGVIAEPKDDEVPPTGPVEEDAK